MQIYCIFKKTSRGFPKPMPGHLAKKVNALKILNQNQKPELVFYEKIMFIDQNTS